jgi:mono/diheme cytochrome c family protein
MIAAQMNPRRLILLPLLATAAVVLGACGSQGIEVQGSAGVQHGAELFAQRCAGCHSLESAGTQGSAYKIRDRERVDGPNFNVRAESVENVLYAIRNGGYSGAIMPENIVVGKDAEAVAGYLAKYSGRDAKAPKSPKDRPAGR